MGLTEILIIVLIAVIILFGGKKISELSRSAGRAVAEFKKGKIEAEKELREMMEEESSKKEKQ